MLQPLRRPRSVETRGALLDAAAQVFVERGFHGASVRQIAERAGFTNPVLYYHFGGKEDLYATVIQTAFDRFQALVGTAVEAESDPRARLEAIAAAYLRFAADDPAALRLLYVEFFRPRSGEPGFAFDELRDWATDQIDTVLQGAAGAFAIDDVPLARRLFVALLGGLLFEQARDPDVAVVDATLAGVVVDAYLHGVARAGARS